MCANNYFTVKRLEKSYYTKIKWCSFFALQCISPVPLHFSVRKIWLTTKIVVAWAPPLALQYEQYCTTLDVRRIRPMLQHTGVAEEYSRVRRIDRQQCISD